jgi:zinc/manganese transport system permease protein
VTASLSADPLHDLGELVRFPFMVNALWAGAIVAVLAAVVGWFTVLRRQTFAGHSLSVMAFPGASGAVLAGIPTTWGFYIACTLAALAIGGTARAPGARRLQTATIGAVQAAGLAAGFFFLSVSASILGGPESLLFGTFLGVTIGQVVGLAAVAVACLATLAVLGRPLLFASVDRDGALARGVPVGRLDLAFLLVLGLAVAAASQITGALLVFALLVAPPAAVQQLTARPLVGLVLSVALGLAISWLALAIAYFSILPVGFLVSALGMLAYLAARLATLHLRPHRR